MTDTDDLMKLQLQPHEEVNYKVVNLWILFEVQPRLA